MIYIVGVDDAEGPPVPIPNTVVKLSGAENTWLEAARENRETPTQTPLSSLGGHFALIAQSVEHAAVNRGVTGSSPVWGARVVVRNSNLKRNPLSIKGFQTFLSPKSGFVLQQLFSENAGLIGLKPAT